MIVRVDTAGPEELGAVAEFYCDTEYAGGILPSDRVVVATFEGRIVGVCRLARENGSLVLRGMRVGAGLRRHGIGARLLDALRDVEEACYCVPHAYLAHLYGKAGFVTVPAAEIPAFLRVRAEQYRAKGLNVVVMRREPVAPDGIT